ncbi:hypothetical protein LCGC14_0327930 [marine sediment metagenome]|uniref:Uncharacterized protein n=1 Tax=marine sediment metagenome TaxID=412755 RepID=A0A0F9TMT7_9ZZZZ
MPIQYESDINSKIDNNLKEFAEAKCLTGVELQKITTHYDLKLTETGNALGINTSALYGKQKASQALQTNVSLLLRLYALFDDKIPRIDPPKLTDLVELIQKVEPSFPDYAIGPILGLEVTSGHRLINKGFEKASQSTRVLAWLVFQILSENLDNWGLVKSVILTEAKARGIKDPTTVFTQGGWGKEQPVFRYQSSTTDGSAVRTGVVKKKLVRRAKTED